MLNPLVVRAVDVGYGHVKFTDGRDAAGDLRTDSIPSQSPAASRKAVLMGAGVLKQRDTFVIPVGGREFEVGRDVHLALASDQETEVLDKDFCLSDAYAARLFGALNYMLPTLPNRLIDVLVLGLPLTNYLTHYKTLAKRFVGTFPINSDGDELTIRACHVYPQPMGSYMSYLATAAASKHTGVPLALCIDPGYNTVDWFLCQGLSPSTNRSDGCNRGMGAVMNAIAEDLIAKRSFDATPAQIVRAIDRSLTAQTPLALYGKEVDLQPYFSAGQPIIDEAVQTIRNKVGPGADIDVILVTGGGASFYASAVQQQFRSHDVAVLEDPALANVRGFHSIGEMLAKSMEQALRLHELREIA